MSSALWHLRLLPKQHRRFSPLFVNIAFTVKNAHASWQPDVSKLSSEDARRRITGILNEFFTIHDSTEALACLSEIAAQLEVC